GVESRSVRSGSGPGPALALRGRQRDSNVIDSHLHRDHALERDRRATCRLGDQVRRGSLEEEEANLVAWEEDPAYEAHGNSQTPQLLRCRAGPGGRLSYTVASAPG